MRIGIKTMGCKSNRFESDMLSEALSGRFDVEEIASVGSFGRREHDIIIVNTCTVTHVADRKSRQAVRALKSASPGARVIVFGCGSNVGREQYSSIEEVDEIFTNRDEIIKYIEALGGEESCGGGHIVGSRTRSLLKIQDGCNNYCSYCIIPFARGPEYSFPSKGLVEEARRKEAQGYKEIVLTGINIGEWKEGKLDLSDLIELLLNMTSQVRFRISSIEPKNFNDKFFRLFQDERLASHIHMSLQSGSKGVLKRMRRNYEKQLFADVCGRLRKSVPNIAITTDVIVGFPGETDEEFKETCDFVEEIAFSKIHIFPYSRRKGTIADKMEGQISATLKKERVNCLRQIEQKMRLNFFKSQIGVSLDVLIEKIEDDTAFGYTDNYIPVQIKVAQRAVASNEYAKIKIVELQDDHALGEFV